MDTVSQISMLQSLIGQLQNEMNVLKTALSLLHDGYKSDTAEIATATQAAENKAAAEIKAFKDSTVGTPEVVAEPVAPVEVAPVSEPLSTESDVASIQ